MNENNNKVEVRRVEDRVLITVEVGMEQLLRDLGLDPALLNAATPGNTNTADDITNAKIPADGSTPEAMDKQNATDDKAEGSTPEKVNQTSASSPKEITRKEQLAGWIKELRDIVALLHSAESAENVHTQLNRLADFLDRYAFDSQIGTYVPNLTGAIRSVRLHDMPRKELITMIEHLIGRIEKLHALEEEREQRAKKVKAIRALGQQFIENADKLADILDLTAIKAILG